MLIGEEVAVTQITGMSIRVPQSAGTVALPPPGSWPYEVETDYQATKSGVEGVVFVAITGEGDFGIGAICCRR
jgi:hypothetical protein